MFSRKYTIVASIMDSAIADLTSVQEQQQAISDNTIRIIDEQMAISKAAIDEVRTASKAIANFKKLFGITLS